MPERTVTSPRFASSPIVWLVGLLVVVVLGGGCTAATALSSPTTETTAPTASTGTVEAPVTSTPAAASVTSATTSSTTSSTAPAPPAFKSAVAAIDEKLGAELQAAGMWSPEVPVSLADLRVLTVTYWGFDSQAHTGRLIVNQAWTGQLAEVFEKLYESRFPIRRMDPIDYLGATGEGIVASDNTMSFNGRRMRGGDSWSMHAYGLAVDINAAENPYIKGDRIIPEPGRGFVDRSVEAPGMILPGGVVTEAFAAVGWKWGGDWKSVKDYMHFSSNGK